MIRKKLTKARRKFNLGRIDEKYKYESLEIEKEGKTIKEVAFLIEEDWREYCKLFTEGKIQ